MSFPRARACNGEERVPLRSTTPQAASRTIVATLSRHISSRAPAASRICCGVHRASIAAMTLRGSVDAVPARWCSGCCVACRTEEPVGVLNPAAPRCRPQRRLPVAQHHTVHAAGPRAQPRLQAAPARTRWPRSRAGSLGSLSLSGACPGPRLAGGAGATRKMNEGLTGAVTASGGIRTRIEFLRSADHRTPLGHFLTFKL